jgi:hypothetical protein
MGDPIASAVASRSLVMTVLLGATGVKLAFSGGGEDKFFGSDGACNLADRGGRLHVALSIAARSWFGPAVFVGR